MLVAKPTASTNLMRIKLVGMLWLIVVGIFNFISTP